MSLLNGILRLSVVTDARPPDGLECLTKPLAAGLAFEAALLLAGVAVGAVA